MLYPSESVENSHQLPLSLSYMRLGQQPTLWLHYADSPALLQGKACIMVYIQHFSSEA